MTYKVSAQSIANKHSTPVGSANQGALPQAGSVVEGKSEGKKYESTENETTFALGQPFLLGRIVEFREDKKAVLGRFFLVNKAISKAAEEVHIRSEEALTWYTLEDLLNKKSELYTKILNRRVIPDIDITVTAKEFARDDVREALLELHKEGGREFKPVQFVIEVEDLEALHQLALDHPTTMKDNSDLVRKVRIKDLQSLNKIQQEARLFDSQFNNNNLQWSKAFPVEASLSMESIDEFLEADLTQLGNLRITFLLILKADCLYAKSGTAFSLKLKALPYLGAICLPKTDISISNHLVIPESVYIAEIGSVYGRLSFALKNQWMTVTTGNIWHSAILEVPEGTVSLETRDIIDARLNVPASVTKLKTGDIAGMIRFAANSKCTEVTTGRITSKTSVEFPEGLIILKTGDICPDARLDVPASVASLEMGFIWGTVRFAANSLCKSIKIHEIQRDGIVYVTSGVTSIEISRYLDGRVALPFDAELESLTIGGRVYSLEEIQAAKEGRLTIENISFQEAFWQ